MDKRLMQDLKNSWRNCNSSTVGFISTIPVDKFSLKPFDPRFKSFAWEFACLIRTRACYLDGLRTGKLSFENRLGIPNKDTLEESPKSEHVELVNNLAKAILEEIEKIETTEKLDLIIWLLQHERIHQGKLMLYFSQLDIELPKSFVQTWGESNFPNKVEK